MSYFEFSRFPFPFPRKIFMFPFPCSRSRNRFGNSRSRFPRETGRENPGKSCSRRTLLDSPTPSKLNLIRTVYTCYRSKSAYASILFYFSQSYGKRSNHQFTIHWLFYLLVNVYVCKRNHLRGPPPPLSGVSRKRPERKFLKFSG